jgi:hypothetical protein
VSPGLVVGILIVLIGAQTVRVVAPGHNRLVWPVLLAVAGFVAGELFAFATRVGGPLLAGLHPIADGVAIGIVEAGGAALGPFRRAP